MFPVQREKLLEASGNSPAELIELEQEIKEAKEEQEQSQQMINMYKEELQRTSKEQDDGKKNEMYLSWPRGIYIVHTQNCSVD